MVSNASLCKFDSDCSVHTNASIVLSCIQKCPIECTKTSIGVNARSKVDLLPSSLLSSETIQSFNFAHDMPDRYDGDLTKYINDNVMVVDICYPSQYFLAFEEHQFLLSARKFSFHATKSL